MMFKYILVVISFLFSINLSAQCDTVMLSESSYSVVKTSSKNGANGGELTFDNKNNTRWRTSGNGPHEIVFDLGKTNNLAGFSTKTRWEGAGRMSDYKVYVTNDTTNWGDGEKFDQAEYPSQKTQDTSYFGAVNGRFVKLIMNSSSGDLQISEFRFYEDTCVNSGKKNQAIDFPVIPKKTTTDAPIALNATVVGGAPINYSIVSGPATISGSTLTLNKSAGVVVVKASVAGSSTHYSSEREIEFTVIDLSTYYPKVTIRLIDDYPLEIKDTSVWYPIYINTSIDESSFLNIEKVRVAIDGKENYAINKNGFYYYAWSPKEFRTYNIDIKVTGSNGNVTTVSKNVVVKQGASTRNVTTLDSAVVWYGKENSRNYYGTYKMPQFTGAYNKVFANLTVQCPDNNCDDWDRYAYIEITAPDGNRIQIIRYITPYNVGCNHSIDLTQYASLLQGEVEFHVFVDTWGTGGWAFTLDLEYTAGAPQFTYSNVNEIWDGNYNFGDPSNLQPVPEITHEVLENTESAELVLSTTGHGWGGNNTGNAAEFYHAKHDIWVGNSKAYLQDLWNKCNPNPDNCLRQQGTWQYDRAGWCPGIIAPPDMINLNAYTTSSSFVLKYKFENSYKDLCHPKNSACQSGVTCADCNAGSNPHYYVDAQVITYSNEPLIYGEVKKTVGTPEFVNPDKDYEIQVFPNPSNGVFSISSPKIDGGMNVSVFSVDGVQHKRYFFNSSLELEAFQFNLADLNSGVYFIEVNNASGSGVARVVID